MKLPKLPKATTSVFEPSDCFITTHYHSPKALREYGKSCALAMRDECAIQCRHWNTAITDKIAAEIDSLEIEI